MTLVLRRLFLSLALCTVVSACGSGSKGTTAGGSGGSSGSSGSGASSGGSSGSGNGEFPSGGTFTVSGADSGSASAKLAGFQSSLTTGTSDGTELGIAAVNGDGTSSAVFSTPTGIASYTFTGNLYFPAQPTSGMTLTNSQTCGSIAFSYGSASKPFEYGFEASSTAGANCTSATSNAGSWTLTLSSVTLVPGVVNNSYTAHGTLNATMPDGMGDTGTLDLTF